jgi:hypothetical protein
VLIIAPLPISKGRIMFDEPNKFAAAAFAAATLLALAGCTTDPTARTSASGVCNAAAAQRLVGQNKPSDADAMRLTGAAVVRQIAPGHP